MSYLTNHLTEIAQEYGFSGKSENIDGVVTFTSSDKALVIAFKHELEATLTMMINGQRFEFKDGACNFADHSVRMVIERLIKSRKDMSNCVAALTDDGWDLEVVNSDYTNNWLKATKKDKKSGLRVSGSSVHLNGYSRRTVAKALYNAGVITSHKQVPGYSGVYSLAQGE